MHEIFDIIFRIEFKYGAIAILLISYNQKCVKIYLGKNLRRTESDKDCIFFTLNINKTTFCHTNAGIGHIFLTHGRMDRQKWRLK